MLRAMAMTATSPTRRRRLRYAVGAIVIAVGLYALATAGVTGERGVGPAVSGSTKG